MVLLSIFVVTFVGLLFFFRFLSPGKLPLFYDEHGQLLAGSMNEKTWVDVYGTRQGLILRGVNMTNPVLLFVHGGPGMPEFFMFEKHIWGLEDHFILCWWDQRGAGLSYSSEIPEASMTISQMIADGEVVTRYLMERFKKEKIYIMGHSWGSFLGIQIVQKYPHLYHAYIGVAQIAYQKESEKIAYAYMIKHHHILSSKLIQRLLKYPILDSDERFYLYTEDFVRDEVMLLLGVGVMRNMDSLFTGIIIPLLRCRVYTIKEKINFLKGKIFSRKCKGLHREMYEDNLMRRIDRLEIPIFFLCGEHDLTVSFELSRTFFERIEAPEKKFYTFIDSAHSPHLEEPERFVKIMCEEVKGLES